MRLFILAFALGLTISPASADEITFRVTNSGTNAISGLTATPLAGEVPEPIPVDIAVGPGDAGEVSFAAPGQQCVFNLTINVAGGEDILRPDVDLCQLEALVIE